ncbi:hypothetical protein [Glycomyces xiaoerkulensis]|uniref:hypothetical protein n=1 Tax=Glycomyces xiaoerkulensis TaxID=2038139 RepID=UPI0012FFE0B5|nr:hypothetical protein [Glycomyces xiaoerkulensis]
MNATRRRLLTLSTPAVLVLASLAHPGHSQAQETDPAEEPAAEDVTTQDSPVLPQQLEDLPELDLPDEQIAVDREPNRATEQIPPLDPLAPATGSPSVAMEDVDPEPPVEPAALDLPTAPAQDLVDATAADAVDTLDAAGRLNDDGTPDLDAGDLQPQVSSAQVVDDTVPATPEGLLDALLAGDLPPDLGVDPLALLEELPDGIPRITYRVCSESETKEVSCSVTLPLGVPAIVDATGDGTPDVLADLLPAAALDDVVPAAQEVLDLQELLEETESTLENLLELMEDPLWLLANPWAVVEAANLENQIETLTATLADKTAALLDIIHVGLAMLEVRLPTSELHGEDLPAHVWAVYDIPGANRLSVGYDGHTRGDSLSTATLGVFTFAPFSTIAGEYDIEATLVNAGSGDSMAVTAGLAGVADTDEGEAVDPTVASARFSPVPTVFKVEAEIRPSTEESDQVARVDAGSDVPTHLDAVILSNDRTGPDPVDRFVQAGVDQVPTDVSALLTWTDTGDHAELDYQASSQIGGLLFADFTYAGGTDLIQATQARAADLPATVEAGLTTADSGRITLDYLADSRLTSLEVAYFDLAGEIVLRGSLTDLPTSMQLYSDTDAGRVRFEGAEALGRAAVDASLGLAEYPPAEGDHATVVTSGTDIGVSAQVSGMQLVDAHFDDHPRLTTVFDPGGQPFHAEGDLDGVHKARAEVSNLPAEAELEVDTAAQQVRYEASDVIDLARFDYTNTETGPTVLAAVHEVPESVALDYETGDVSRLLYDASGAVPQVDFFASFDHIEQLDPTGHEYLSARIEELPATIDVAIDFPARRLEGALSSELGGIDVVARFGLEDRVWTGMAALTGVPTRFDADWDGGGIRARGLTGAIDTIDLAAANHPDATAPVGLRLAAHYRETTGDIDAAVSTRDLSHVEYADDGESQSFRLDTDTGGDPVFVDIDALLADPDDATVDDLRLALLGRVDDLPSTLNVEFTGDRLSYTADRNVGLELEARLGKLAALDGLAAPLYDNGIGAVARTCETGTGCAEDETPFCPDTGCLGVVATVNLPGLPTEAAVDLDSRTVELTGYEPPAADLQAYVRLIGLLDDLPDLSAEATLSDLPPSLDFAVGPITFGDGEIDLAYSSSEPLGDLTLEANADTVHPDFPHLRALASLTGLPQTFDLSADLAARTEVAMDNADPVDRLALTVTGADEGYLDGALDDIPAQVNVVVDTPASQVTGQMSAPLGGIELLAANIPFEGDRWGAWLGITGVPAGFEVGWGGGGFRFETTGGPLAEAAAAVANHPDAVAPTGSHFAANYRESTGDLDASASVSDLTRAAYTTEGDDQSFDLDMASQKIALDADAVFAADGVDDTRLALIGTLVTPDGLDVVVEDGVIAVQTRGANLAAELQAWAGKVEALEGLGTPIFDNGIAARAAGCQPGEGCSTDTFPAFCEVFDECFGAAASVNLPGLPDELTVDTANQQVNLGGLESPGNKLELFVELDGVLSDLPSTAGLLTLEELPDTLDLTVGPFQFGGDGCRNGSGEQRDMCLAYEASETVGTLTAQMQAETADYGDWLGSIDLDPVPRSLEVTGVFGEESEVTTVLSEGLDDLTVRAMAEGLTGLPEGDGSALARLEQVPADEMSFTVRGFGEEAMGVPTVVYRAAESTLDGLFEVEADLVAAFPIGDEAIPLAGNAVAEFENLGATTGVSILQSSAVAMESQPGTESITLGARISSSYDRQEIDREVFSFECLDIGLASGRVTGHYAVPEFEVDDLELTVSGLETLNLLPSQNVTYLATGLTGTYDRIAIDIGGLTVEPDIDLDFDVEAVGVNVFHQDFTLDSGDAVDGINFHVSKNGEWNHAGTLELDVPGVGPVPVPVYTDPGKTHTGVNHIEIDGDDGEQVLNYLDLEPFPIDVSEDFQSVMIHLLTMFVLNPFGASDEDGAEPDDPEDPDDDGICS